MSQIKRVSFVSVLQELFDVRIESMYIQEAAISTFITMHKAVREYQPAISSKCARCDHTIQRNTQFNESSDLRSAATAHTATRVPTCLPVCIFCPTTNTVSLCVQLCCCIVWCIASVFAVERSPRHVNIGLFRVPGIIFCLSLIHI